MSPDWFHPVVDVESEPFWTGCREQRLMIKHCKACDSNFFYPRAYCPSCWSEDTEWIQASGKGVLHSFSIVHQYPVEPFASLVPFGNILVDLEEGPRLMANWDFSVPVEEMNCDMAVEVVFRKVNEDLTIPIFRPCA